MLCLLNTPWLIKALLVPTNWLHNSLVELLSYVHTCVRFQGGDGPPGLPGLHGSAGSDGAPGLQGHTGPAGDAGMRVCGHFLFSFFLLQTFDSSPIDRQNLILRKIQSDNLACQLPDPSIGLTNYDDL